MSATDPQTLAQLPFKSSPAPAEQQERKNLSERRRNLKAVSHTPGIRINGVSCVCNDAMRAKCVITLLTFTVSDIERPRIHYRTIAVVLIT